MRIGIQSIVFGEEPAVSLGELLAIVKSLGYEGIELFQDVCNPKYTFGTPEEIFEHFHHNQIALLGVTSGAVNERVEFVRRYIKEAEQRGANDSIYQPYIYVDKWTPRCDSALKEGVKFAIHPHMFRPIQTMREVLKILNEYPLDSYPHLTLMPDTAHLTIAGEDPIDIFMNHRRRIESVHLKDWKRNVGRSFQFYATGFTELGNGDVQIEEFLTALWTRNYQGWLVIEHDYSKVPSECLKGSVDWLKSNLPPHLRSKL